IPCHLVTLSRRHPVTCRRPAAGDRMPAMAYRSLADFLEKLARQGDLVHVAADVDPELEIAEITRRVARAAGPALLFEQVRGQPLSVVTNLLGTESRLCQALAIDGLSELAPRLV